MRTPLENLAVNEWGIIREVRAPDDDLARLMAMGVCLGRTVQLLQRGDPLVLRVYGSRVGVSARLARRVIVEPGGLGECPRSGEAFACMNTADP